MRLAIIAVILAALGAREILLEHHFAWLRPGQHMYAYVANHGDGTVSMLDLVRLSRLATIPVGPEPSSMRTRPRTREIWGLSGPGGYVWVISGGTGGVAAKIFVGLQPSSLEFSPDGRTAYVTLEGENQLAIIDAEAHTVAARLPVGRRPGAVQITADGQLLLVANRGDATLTVLDAHTQAMRATVPVVPDPDKIAVLPDDSKAFVSSASSALLSVVNLRSNELVTNLSLGGRASDLILKPDGGELYVPSPQAHGLLFVNTSANEVADFMLLGLGPQTGMLLRDGRLIVADTAGGRIVPVTPDDRLAQPSEPVGEGPVAIDVTPGGAMWIIADRDSNDVAVLRGVDGQMITMIPTGRTPIGVAILLF